MTIEIDLREGHEMTSLLYWFNLESQHGFGTQFPGSCDDINSARVVAAELAAFLVDQEPRLRSTDCAIVVRDAQQVLVRRIDLGSFQTRSELTLN